jgi:hypothetical protein
VLFLALLEGALLAVLREDELLAVVVRLLAGALLTERCAVLLLETLFLLEEELLSGALLTERCAVLLLETLFALREGAPWLLPTARSFCERLAFLVTSDLFDVAGALRTELFRTVLSP